jgi:hypothetical protein
MPGAPHLARFSRDVGYRCAQPETHWAGYRHLRCGFGGIPHLAKNERDVGHPVSVVRTSQEVVRTPGFCGQEGYLGLAGFCICDCLSLGLSLGNILFHREVEGAAAARIALGPDAASMLIDDPAA